MDLSVLKDVDGIPYLPSAMTIVMPSVYCGRCTDPAVVSIVEANAPKNRPFLRCERHYLEFRSASEPEPFADRFKRIAEEVGNLVTVKNQAYGSSFARSGEFLKLIYPDGIPVDAYTDALLIVRVFDKLMRLATNGDPDGENPWQDIAGYGVLGVSLRQNEEKNSE